MKKESNFRKIVEDFLLSVAESNVSTATAMLGQLLGGGALVTLLPNLPNMMLSFKQKRAERNIKEFFQQIENRIKQLEDIKNLNPEMVEDILYKVLSITFDYVVNEREVSKMPYLAEGFCFIVKNGITDELIVMEYFDLMEQVREIELQVLVDIYLDELSLVRVRVIDEKYLEKRGLTEYQYSIILNKLLRLRLLAERINTTGEGLHINRRVTSVRTSIYLGQAGKNFIEFFFDEEGLKSIKETSGSVQNYV